PPRPCMPRRCTAHRGTAASGISPTNYSARPSRALTPTSPASSATTIISPPPSGSAPFAASTLPSPAASSSAASAITFERNEQDLTSWDNPYQQSPAFCMGIAAYRRDEAFTVSLLYGDCHGPGRRLPDRGQARAEARLRACQRNGGV